MECPPLYPDTEAVLALVRASRSVVTVLFSEGNPERLERILRAHDIRRKGLFDAIIIGPKSKEAFEEAKRRGRELLPGIGGYPNPPVVLIGDSLHRDIKLGKQAGLMTVYKPSSFTGNEEPSDDDRPDRTISDLGELPTVLDSLLLTA